MSEGATIVGGGDTGGGGATLLGWGAPLKFLEGRKVSLGDLGTPLNDLGALIEGWGAQLDLALGRLSRYTSWLHLSAIM